MKITMNSKVQGQFQLFTLKDGKADPITHVMSNLLVDGFLAWLDSAASVTHGVTSTTVNSRCSVGTGSTPPAFTNTALESQIGFANTRVIVNNTATYITETDEVEFVNSTRFTFNQGAIVGNISELGIFYGNLSTSTDLQARSLIKDLEGNPTTKTITADDQLVVNYDLISRVPRTVLFNFTADSVDYSLTGKLCGVGQVDRMNATNYALGALHSPVNTSRICPDSYTFPAFTSTTFGAGSNTFSVTAIAPVNVASGKKSKLRVPLAAGNFSGGFTGLSIIHQGSSSPLATGPQWQFQISPKLPKTNSFVFDIEFFSKSERA